MKQKIVFIIAFLAYWLGVDAVFYWLNRKAKRILTFHNVMPVSCFDSKTTVLSDSEESFRYKIRLLKRRWRFSNDLNDPSTLTVSFDDGFLNEYEIAGRILKEEGDIPAIIFAVGNLIGETDPLKAPAVDLLTHWNACAPNGKYELRLAGRSEPIPFELTDANRFQTWVNVVRPLYAQDGESRGRNVLAAFDRLYPVSKILEGFSKEYLRLRLTGISREQISNLRARGWLVGSHSNSHCQFSSLSSEDKVRELVPFDEQARQCVFSYPYGEMTAIDAETIALTERAGYPGALCNLPDGGGRAGRYFFPRFALPDNKYLLHFELSGLKVFLQTRRLLFAP